MTYTGLADGVDLTTSGLTIVCTHFRNPVYPKVTEPFAV
jgi:hypothetical protein